RLGTDPYSVYPLGYSMSLQSTSNRAWSSVWEENDLPVPAFSVIETVIWNRYQEGTARQDITAYKNGENTQPVLRRYWDETAGAWGPAKVLGGLGGGGTNTSVVSSLPSTPEPGTIYFVTGCLDPFANRVQFISGMERGTRYPRRRSSRAVCGNARRKDLVRAVAQKTLCRRNYL